MTEPRAHGTDTLTSERPTDALQFALVILVLYLGVTAGILVRCCATQTQYGILVVHLAALALVLLAWRHALPATLRCWAPLLVGPLLYVELRWLIPAVGRPHADALVALWEHATFPSDPSRTLATRWDSRLLSELLHTAYVSYYAVIYVPPALLWLRGRRSAYASTVTALIVVYASCFTTYLLFPVDGPRFSIGPARAPDGPVRAFVIALLHAGSSRGSAFPSSHVAAAVVASICALRFTRRTGLVVSALTVGIALGAVYGGYHYAIDTVAGAMTGCLCAGLAYCLERLAQRRQLSVTAPH